MEVNECPKENMEYATKPQNPLEVILPNTTFWGWVGQEEWPIDIGGNAVNDNVTDSKEGVSRKWELSAIPKKSK